MRTAASLSYASRRITRSPRSTRSPCLTGKLVDDAHYAGGERNPLLRVCLAGDANGACMHDAWRRNRRHRPQDSLGLLGLGGLLLALALRAADRGKLARRDPGCKPDQHDQSGQLVKSELSHASNPLPGRRTLSAFRLFGGSILGGTGPVMVGSYANRSGANRRHSYIKVALQYSHKKCGAMGSGASSLRCCGATADGLARIAANARIFRAQGHWQQASAG